MLLILPNEILVYLLEFIEQIDLISVLRVNKQINNIIIKSIIKNRSFKDACKYGEIVTLFRHHDRCYILYSMGMFYICKYNHFRLLKKIMDEKIYNIWLRYYVIGNNISHIEYSLRGACRGGHIDIIKYLLPSTNSFCPTSLLYACKSGNLEAVNLMFSHSEKNPLSHPIDYSGLLYSSCKSGNISLVKFIINKGTTDWNSGLRGACVGGNIDIAILMLEYGASNANYSLSYTCAHIYRLRNKSKLNEKRMDNYALIIRLLLGKYHPHDSPRWYIYCNDLKSVFYDICCFGWADVINECKEYITPDIVNQGLYEAVTHHNLNIMKMMISLGATNINEMLISACKSSNIYTNNSVSKKCVIAINNVIKLLISNGADVSKCVCGGLKH